MIDDHNHSGVQLVRDATAQRRWSALALIVTAQFMVILDVAIVNVALPSIKTDLGFTETSLQWVVSAYAIIFGGALLLGGRLADILGRRRMFVTGLGLSAVITSGLMLLVYAMTRAASDGWGTTTTIGLLAGSVALILAFIAVELRTAHPLLPLRIFRSRTLSVANTTMTIVGAVAFSEFFLLTLYLQNVLHYSPVQSGAAFVAFAGTVVVISNVAQLVVGRIGVRPTLAAGMGLSALSVGLLTGLPVHGHYFSDLFPASVLGGAGTGLSIG